MTISQLKTAVSLSVPKSEILTIHETDRVTLLRSRKRRVLAGLGILCSSALALAPATAVAATAVGTMAVSATVTATCTVATAPLAFAAYTGVADPVTGTISVTCTNTTPYDIGLDQGLGTGATVTTRSMSLAGASLGYGLFTDAAFTANWNNTGTTDTAGLVGTGLPVVTNIFGQIPAGELVAPGAYTDTITATVTY
jgi:spore coat protein U-like protein